MVDTQHIPVHFLSTNLEISECIQKQAFVEHVGLENGRVQMDKWPFKAANGHAILLVGRVRGPEQI
jgi:hypothetical protein